MVRRGGPGRSEATGDEKRGDRRKEGP